MEGVKTSADRFLELIAREGWTEERAQRFEDGYGAAIKRLLILYLWRIGLISYRCSLDHAMLILSDRKQEILENTLSDLWIELLRGLIRRYVHGRIAGTVNRPFLAYLAGTIKNLLIDNAQRAGLLPRQSEAEMLKALAAAKQERTLRGHIARVKFHFWGRVQEAILSNAPRGQFDDVYAHLSQLTAYFFERYLVDTCRSKAYDCRKGRIENIALDFMRSDYEEGLAFAGKITPYCSEAAVTRCYPHSEMSTDEFLTSLSLGRAGV